MPATLFYLSYRALIYLSIVLRMRILENIHMREQNFHSHMYATWLSFTNKLQIHCSAHKWTDIFGVRSGTKSILRFRGLGNTSSPRKLFFESLSVVFVASVPCLRVVASLVSSYCFLRGTVGFSSFRRNGLMSSLRHFYVFVSSGLPFVDCATYLGRYLMYGDIHCTDSVLA